MILSNKKKEKKKNCAFVDDLLSRFDGIIQLHVRHRMHLHINTHIPRDKSPSSSASLTAKRACNSGNITREIERFFFIGI